MQDRHLCSPPLLFPWPRSGPPTFFILESPLKTARTVSRELYWVKRVYIGLTSYG